MNAKMASVTYGALIRAVNALLPASTACIPFLVLLSPRVSALTLCSLSLSGRHDDRVEGEVNAAHVLHVYAAKLKTSDTGKAAQQA